MNCSLFYMFPVAVASFKSDKHEDYKRVFFDRMPEHCITHESGQGLISGESSGKVYLHTDEAFRPFFEFVSQCIASYLDQLSYDRSRIDIHVIKTWISVTDNQTVTPTHAHGTSHLSFVYYMNMPKEADVALSGDVFLIFNEPAPNYATGVFDPRTWRSFGNACVE